MIFRPAPRRLNPVLIVPLMTALLACLHVAGAQQKAKVHAIDRDYSTTIQPLLKRYCYECHADDVTEGEIDFAVFQTLADVRKETKVWLKVGEMLDSRQMPPKDARQPSDEQHARLQGWVREFLTSEARAHAGDPGPIVLRRLNNAEYAYTVRDLTGVDSLDPTREFPVDGAAGEGFTNVGSGQGMSPALVRKYLDAAKAVADHVVLLPEGIRFSPHTTRRDHTDELLARIQAFYRQFTVDGGDTTVDLPGIQFDARRGGLLPLEQYLTATLDERDALIVGQTTIEKVARRRSLNARYLKTLWNTLAGPPRGEPSFLLDSLREKWRQATPDDMAALAAEIEAAQNALWKFNSIGHIGRQGGPTCWMEAVSPVTASHPLRLKLPDTPAGKDVTVYLVAGDLGDGNDQDFVVWRRPRIEFATDDSDPAHPPILLRDIRSLSAGIEQTLASQLKDTAYGLDPARFGKHPNGSSLDAIDLCLRAPQVIEVRLPAKLVAGGQFVATGLLHACSAAEGSIQLQVLFEKPEPSAVSLSAPVLVTANSEAKRRVEAGLAAFRELFPPVLCYARIVPVDEVVTLTLFYREDDHLKRLMLDDRQAAELDRLWDELTFVSREPLQSVVAFEQISEFATQDRPDLVKAFAPLRTVINKRAGGFRRQLVAAEPAHVGDLLEFANRAWRRPLAAEERQSLRDLYGRLRDGEIPHEEALRLTLARVLTSPAFLYKLEQPAPGRQPARVTDYELATRLSFFLWSSLPDDELRTVADEGRLGDAEAVLAQTRRMLADPRTRRLAIQFACQWLHLRDFDKNDDKNEKLYPQFTALRGDMYEETVQFFADMFRGDGSIMDILDADHTFLNRSLANHYGIDLLQNPARFPGADRTSVKEDQWRRVDGVRSQGRGGILGMATFLASQSGASRTSPILRGNWVYETLLGERLPRPPAGVPQLPEEVPRGLTARQLIEQHTGVAACAKCHERIDPFGFALEQYDAIGRRRPQTVDTNTTLAGGHTIQGIQGLRDYLAGDRRADVVRQFCRKLLGYALGREVQLSDEPLLEEMRTRLAEGDYRFSVAVEAIVTSPQFRRIRGQPMSEN